MIPRLIDLALVFLYLLTLKKFKKFWDLKIEFFKFFSPERFHLTSLWQIETIRYIKRMKVKYYCVIIHTKAWNNELQCAPREQARFLISNH